MNPRLLACLAIALASPAGAAERTYTVTDFTRVRVDGDYRIKMSTGVAPFARASGSPSALDAVSIEVQGQTLIVRKNASSWGGFPGEKPGPVEISVGTHGVETVWVNGSASLAIDKAKGQSLRLSLQGPGSLSVGNIAVDKLDAALTGSGSLALGGKAARAIVSVSGPGAIDGSKLTTTDADVDAEGDAVVKLIATNTADVRSLGTASVELGGKPACTVHAGGSATVTGCR
jgi:hypothetical protein